MREFRFLQITVTLTLRSSHLLRKFSKFIDRVTAWKVSVCVSLRIQSEYGKIQTRKTPNTEAFHAVNVALWLHLSLWKLSLCITTVAFRNLSNIFDWGFSEKLQRAVYAIFFGILALFNLIICLILQQFVYYAIHFLKNWKFLIDKTDKSVSKNSNE